MRTISKDAIEKLKKVKFFILDMDGTIYLGERLFSETKKFLEFLEKRKINYIFFTNNSSKSAKDYVLKLKKMGISVEGEKIFTSGQATIIYLKNETSYKRIYLLGTPSLKEEFKNEKFIISSKNPSCVVLGFDTTITYRKLRTFCDLVRKGLPYIATNPDKVCPIEDGFLPDSGAIISFVFEATGRKPDFIVGKPSEKLLEIIIKKYMEKSENIAFIGDRLYTDVHWGKKVGILTILTLTGEAKIDDLKSSSILPDIIIENLEELVEIFHW